MDGNSFEVDPWVKKSEEQILPPDQNFEESFKNGVPSFSGFGSGEKNSESDDAATEYNEGLADAIAIINYGIDAAVREEGENDAAAIQKVINVLRDFDVSNSENPIRDLFRSLGVESREEMSEVRDEADASAPAELELRTQYSMPKTDEKSREGAIAAIESMKELIAEVEGASPIYDDLRQGARAAGMGVFEYAVKKSDTRSLTELFKVLAEQRENTREVIEKDEDKKDEIKDLDRTKEERIKEEPIKEELAEGEPVEEKDEGIEKAEDEIEDYNEEKVEKQIDEEVKQEEELKRKAEQEKKDNYEENV